MKSMKRFFCLLIIMAVISSVFILCVNAADSDSGKVTPSNGINYAVDDVIVPGTVKTDNDGDISAAGDFFINLTQESIIMPSGYTVAAYSLDGGLKWKAISSKPFNDVMLAKFFSKDFTLVLTDKYNKKDKIPDIGATVVSFAKINARPKTIKYVINYLIGADSTGATTGEWVLTEKNSNVSVKEGIEVAVEINKEPDGKGYGRFYGKDGSTDGIAIQELPLSGKTAKTAYLVRYGATDNDNGTYTAASKPKKFNVESQQKASAYKVNEKGKSIKYKANTHIFKSEGKIRNANLKDAELKTEKGEIDLNDYSGDIYLWKAATAKKPASAKQKMSITGSASGVSASVSVVSVVGVESNSIRVSNFSELSEVLTHPADESGNPYDTIIVTKSINFEENTDIFISNIDKTIIEIIGEAAENGGDESKNENGNESEDMDGRIVLRSANLTRHFIVESGSGVIFSNIILDGDNIGGGIDNSGEVTLEQGATIQNCHAEYGGAIYNDNDGVVNIKSGGAIIGNDVYYNGGDAMTGNGGGIYNGGGTITLAKGGLISKNSAANGGGGIYSAAHDEDAKGVVDIYGTVSENMAPQAGGIANMASRLNIKNGGSVSKNTAMREGGGIINWQGGLTVEDGGSVIGNTAKQGGGVYNCGGTITVAKGGRINENIAENNGGGIFNTGYFDANGSGLKNLNGKITVSGTIKDNTVGEYGGGIYNDSLSDTKNTVTVESTGVIESNTAKEYGYGFNIYSNNVNNSGNTDNGTKDNTATAASDIAVKSGGIVKCTVQFNANGGNRTVGDIVINYRGKVTEPTAPTRTEHTFAGWYKDAALLNPYNFSDIVLDNIMLYAKWQSVSGNDQPVTGVTLNKSAVTLKKGGAETLTATVAPANATNKAVVWRSSDPSIAAVEQNGRITAKGVGTAVITAETRIVTGNTTYAYGYGEHEYISATCEVSVEPAASDKTATGSGVNITLNKTSAKIAVGGAATLTATVTPADTADKSVSWSSSNSGVAEVDQNGSITAKAVGTAVIKATAVDGGKTASCTVTVSATADSSDDTNTPQKLYIDRNGTEYIETTNINAHSSPYIIEFEKSEIKNGKVYVGIPARILSELTKIDSDFIIEIATPYGIYQIPATLASLVPDINDMLTKNNLKIGSASFKITLTDLSSDTAVNTALNADMPKGKALSSAVDFTIELAVFDAAGKTGTVIGEINNFSERIVRLIPLSQNIDDRPEYWGAFRYNKSMKRFEFIPHTTQVIGGTSYAVVKSVTNSTYIAAKNSVTFADIKLNEWYTEYITKAASKKLVQGIGNGLYEPERQVTRAEFIQMTVNSMQLPKAKSDTKAYGDVQSKSWHYDAIMRAKSAGFLAKFSGDNFYPDRVITREEMAVILAAAVKYENPAGLNFNLDDVKSLDLSGVFSDYSSIAVAALDDIKLVYCLEVMNGIGYSLFSPKGTSTRAQAATVQIRLLELLGFIDRN